MTPPSSRMGRSRAFCLEPSGFPRIHPDSRREPDAATRAENPPAGAAEQAESCPTFSMPTRPGDTAIIVSGASALRYISTHAPSRPIRPEPESQRRLAPASIERGERRDGRPASRARPPCVGRAGRICFGKYRGDEAKIWAPTPTGEFLFGRLRFVSQRPSLRYLPPIARQPVPLSVVWPRPCCVVRGCTPGPRAFGRSVFCFEGVANIPRRLPLRRAI